MDFCPIYTPEETCAVCSAPAEEGSDLCESCWIKAGNAHSDLLAEYGKCALSLNKLAMTHQQSQEIHRTQPKRGIPS